MTTEPNEEAALEFDRLVAEYNASRTLHYGEGVVVSELQTCGACPTQWEGELRDGRLFYFRYRWGHATLGIGWTHDEAVGDPETVGMDIGEGLDGFLGDIEYRRTRDELLAARGL